MSKLDQLPQEILGKILSEIDLFELITSVQRTSKFFENMVWGIIFPKIIRNEVKIWGTVYNEEQKKLLNKFLNTLKWYEISYVQGQGHLILFFLKILQGKNKIFDSQFL